MYFGDYLVSQNVISSEQLVLSLIFQIESMPSIYQVIFDEKIINAEVFLKYLKNEAKNENEDLVGQLRKDDLISENKLQELFLKQISKKIPLGEIICRLNFSTPEIINHHLKNYYDKKFHEVEDKKETAKSNDTVEISEAALESLKELGMDISSVKSEMKVPTNPFIDQFLELFTEKFKNKILKLLQIMKKTVDDGADITNYINSLYRDVHLLKGSVMLAELKLIEEIVTLLDEKIEKQLSSDSTKLNQWFKVSYPQIENSIKLFWKYTENIAASKSEEQIGQSEEFLLLLSQLNEDLLSI